jgi:hypothetical protein
VNTGELLHSKTTRNEGKCESEEARAAVIAKVQAYLDSLKA